MPSDVGSEAKECAMIIAEYHGRLELPWTAELPALVYYFYNFGDRRSFGNVKRSADRQDHGREPCPRI